jgi:hypothetical protein
MILQRHLILSIELGSSTKNFPEALQTMLGPDTLGLSPQNISRLKAKW